MLLTLIIYINILRIKRIEFDRNKLREKFSNFLYAVSYSFPINIFVKEGRKLSKNEKRIEKKIKELDLMDRFNLRSFMALITLN